MRLTEKRAPCRAPFLRSFASAFACVCCCIAPNLSQFFPKTWARTQTGCERATAHSASRNRRATPCPDPTGSVVNFGVSDVARQHHALYRGHDGRRTARRHAALLRPPGEESDADMV